MPGSVDACHGRNKVSRNGPKCRRDWNLFIFLKLEGFEMRMKMNNVKDYGYLDVNPL
jgi:hypothetical protein